MSDRLSVSLIIILLITAVFQTAFLYAQDGTVLKWEPVDGAGGYVLEIRDSQKKLIVERNLDVTRYDISKLSPGHYQYRLTTLNKLMRKGNNTGWINFYIEKAVIPVLKTVSRKVLYHSSDNPPLIVNGENFLSDIRLYLKKDSESIELDTRFISGSELEVSLRSEKKISGVYNLVAVNRGGFEAVMKSAIEISDPVIPAVKSVAEDKSIKKISEDKALKSIPEKKNGIASNGFSCFHNLSCGAGWDMAVPVGEWSSKLESSLTGFHLYLSFPVSEFMFLKNTPVLKDFGIEAVFNYAGYNFTDGTSSESFSKGGCYAGINYTLIPALFTQDLSPILNLDAGMTYSAITIVSYKQLKDYSSFDYAVKCGLSFRYKWLEHFFTDLSAGYGRTFYVSHPLGEMTLSLRAGVIL